MAMMKHTTKKRTVQEDNRCTRAGPQQAGKVPQKDSLPNQLQK